MLELTVNGASVEVPDDGDTLLGVLRDHLRLTGAKDGCSPQGQCGCCTVLVDGQPRVACVTPARRVRNRSITTIEGLDEVRAELWGQALCGSGGSQCGFCTPGIILRLEATLQKSEDASAGAAEDSAHQALLAHVCRCTGWQTITEAYEAIRSGEVLPTGEASDRERRAELEGGVAQIVSGQSVLGSGGFAADTAPDGALIAVLGPDDQWYVGETVAHARTMAGKVQGRRTTAEPDYPIALPDGDFVATLQTTWTDPAYVETDASWCEPGGVPASSVGNGGAFGGKAGGEIESAARQLADQLDRTVLALYSREDVMRRAPKRPPLAAGIRSDGSGVIRIARAAGAEALIHRFAPQFDLEVVDVPGPVCSLDVRGAVWAEIAALRSALLANDVSITVVSPAGGTATVEGDSDRIAITVSAGKALDRTTLRSYCIGAAHMGWSWVRSEAMAVDPAGEILDLTVRSLGIVRAVDTPLFEVEIVEDSSEPVNGSDAVFAAVAALAWRNSGYSQRWPTGLGGHA